MNCKYCHQPVTRTIANKPQGHAHMRCARKAYLAKKLFNQSGEMDNLYNLWVEAGGMPCEL